MRDDLFLGGVVIIERFERFRIIRMKREVLEPSL